MTSTAGVLIGDARNYAANAVTNAQVNMNFAIEALNSLGQGVIGTPGTPINITPPQPGDPGAPPAYLGQHFTTTAFTGTRPNITDPGDLNMPTAPDNVPVIAVFDAPQQPIGANPDPASIGAAPGFTDVSVPSAPDLNAEIRSIVAPQLISVTIPSAPIFVDPGFNGVKPDFDSVPMPTNLDAMMRTQYDIASPLFRDAVTANLDAFIDREFPSFRTGLASLEARLNTYLQGGTALTAAVEDAIHSRTLDKTNIEGRRAAAKAWGEGSRAGFTIAGPTLLSQLQDIDQERRNNNSRAAIDIAIKQAELEQANLQFAVTQSTNLRSMMINAGLAYYSGLVTINGQALEYARSVVDAIVKAYDIATRAAEIKARIYEAEARVYESRLRAALAVIQVYEAQVRGIEAQVNVNLAQVQAYKARLEAVGVEAQVYRAQVEGALAGATIERARADVYTARVQAFGASVNAYTARWQGYEAAVRGEAAKVQASAEPVRAYTAQVQAYESHVKALTAEFETKNRANETRLAVYKTDIDAYTALNRSRAEAVMAEVASFDTTIKAFIAKANAISEHSRAEIASYEAGLRALIAQAEISLRHLTETNRINVARAEGIARVGVAAGAVYSGVAQSTLAGMNTLAAEIVDQQG